MNNNEIFFKNSDLVYESFRLLMFQISSNLMRCNLDDYKNKVKNATICDLTSEEFFKTVNRLNYEVEIGNHNKYIVKSLLLNKAVIIPQLPALLDKENSIFFIKILEKEITRDYSETTDLKLLISYLFINFYERNIEIIKRKINKKYFIEIKTSSVNNIIWGLAKIIRDNLAHNLSFTDDSGSETFKVLKNHTINFLGKNIPISSFESKKVDEIFNSIDLIIFMYLMEQEIHSNPNT